MFDTIQIPVKSKFDGDTAIELLHLIEQVYRIYEGESPRLVDDRDFTGTTIYSSKSYYRSNSTAQSDPNSKEKFKFSDNKLNPKLSYQVLEHIEINEQFHFGTGDKAETTIALILKREKKLYFVFRGTRELTEWVQNSNYASEYLNKIQSLQDTAEAVTVSKGFIDLYCHAGKSQRNQPGLKSIEDRISDFLANSASLDGIEEVYICGHSLGGAMATIAAVQIRNILEKYEHRIKPIVYTYASPRVGNKQFAEIVQQSTKFCYRIYNTEDLVPCLPLSCDIRKLKGDEMKENSTQKERVFKTSGTANDSKPEDESWVTKSFKKLVDSIVDISHNMNMAEKMIVNIINGIYSSAEYCHTGESIPFTTNTSHVSTNHNLYCTYGVAIDNGWSEVKSLISPAIQTQTNRLEMVASGGSKRNSDRSDRSQKDGDSSPEFN
jgi:hypothetical protein